MIEEQVKIHDKFSVEIKLGFQARLEKVNEFSVRTWLFLPNSLDITRHNYDKSDFYRDLKSNIRLITPVYALQELSDADSEPGRFLSEAIKNLKKNIRNARSNYEYHIRMYVTIVRSALREEIAFILQNQDKDKNGELKNQSANNRSLIDNYINSTRQAALNYRKLGEQLFQDGIDKALEEYFYFGDEYLSNVIEQHTFKLIQGIQGKSTSAINPDNAPYAGQLMELILKEIEYRKSKGMLIVEKDSKMRNRDLVFRLSMLKKYAENELFLDIKRQREGVLVEQIWLSIAAGISMVFATAIAFSFQRQFGNLTMPFFVALVISYMLKDRIKELARYLLAHRWGRRFFDIKTEVSLNEHRIGWSKEGMDFLSEKKVPQEVMRMRQRSSILEAENRNNSEQIILYRKLVRLRRDILDKVSPYPLAGMNDIIRFNVSNYVQKMDNPEVPLFIPGEDGTPDIIKGEKMYYLNLIMRLRHAEGVKYKRYRIVMNRKGIVEVEAFPSDGERVA